MYAYSNLHSLNGLDKGLRERRSCAHVEVSEGSMGRHAVVFRNLLETCLIATLSFACSARPANNTPPASSGPTLQDVRAIAKDAYIYGFPVVVNYKTMHTQAIDTTSKDYRAPFNTIGRTSDVATPDDKFVVTPNSDTPYTFLWADLRAEPVVITVPKIEKNRYYTGQMIDLYTFNFSYLGTRAFGNDGGVFLLAGPGWKGDTPAGIKAVIRTETEFAYVLFRTQLFGPADLSNVDRIQKGYDAKPLSTYLKTPAPPAAAAVSWPAPRDEMLTTAALFPYLNFMLQFCPVHPSEKALMERFATLNIGAGKTFDMNALSPDQQKAVQDGIAAAAADLGALIKKINAEEISSSEMFGTREFLKNNYLYRFGGAKLGLYGNSGEEAIYLAYFVDQSGTLLYASKHGYHLTFPKGGLPPARAFWSLTMYDGKTQLLVANPLKRYLLNSTLEKSFKYGTDGSLTLYVQKDSPGAALQSNWLPAPDGPFYAILRIYMPAPEVVSGAWKKPPLQPAP